MKSVTKFLVLFMWLLAVFIPDIIYPSAKNFNMVKKIQLLVFRDYLYSNKIETFINLTDVFEAYIRESRRLFLSGPYNTREWIETSMKMGYILGIYVDTGENIYRFGKRFEPDLAAFDHVYIDERGYLHTVIADRMGTHIDMVLNIQAMNELVKNFSVLPTWIVLYDEGKKAGTPVVGTDKIEYYEVFTELRKINDIKKGFVEGRFVLSHLLQIENTSIYLIAGYTPVPDRHAIFLFGLIGLFVLAILLLYFLIKYLILILIYKNRGVEVMGKEEEGFDIIDEIDKEVTGIIKGPENEKELKKDKKEASSAREKKSQQAASDMEDDGIFIKK